MIRGLSLLLFASLAAQPTLAAPAKTRLPPADTAAVFKAAGFALRGKQWKSDCGDPGTATYSPGQIEEVRDLNGDGLAEAIVTEGGTYCYGNTGTGFWVVSKQRSGGWRLITNETGIPNFLKTKGAAGWPDIEIGGPGFCFPVHRWNGKAYAVHHFQYEGKACRPNR